MHISKTSYKFASVIKTNNMIYLHYQFAHRDYMSVHESCVCSYEDVANTIASTIKEYQCIPLSIKITFNPKYKNK